MDRMFMAYTVLYIRGIFVDELIKLILRCDDLLLHSLHTAQVELVRTFLKYLIGFLPDPLMHLIHQLLRHRLILHKSNLEHNKQ